MPTYEYECEGCGHKFEQFQSMTAKPTRVCPECGKRKVKRLISAGAGMIFKGSGFYATDYRSDGYKKAAKKDKDGTSSKGTGGASGKETASSSTTKDTSSKSDS